MESLRQAQHAFNRRDKPAWLATFHPDATDRSVANVGLDTRADVLEAAGVGE